MSDDEKINELRLAFVRQDRKISELEKDVRNLQIEISGRWDQIDELKEKFENHQHLLNGTIIPQFFKEDSGGEE